MPYAESRNYTNSSIYHPSSKPPKLHFPRLKSPVYGVGAGRVLPKVTSENLEDAKVVHSTWQCYILSGQEIYSLKPREN
jgi:hypothetical protein